MVSFISGATALLNSVTMESAKATKRLLEAGAWINKTPNKESELHKAASNGLYDILKMLLSDERITVEDINKYDEYHSTPVYRAAYSGHRECLRLLIDSGGRLGHRSTKNKGTIFNAIFAHVPRPAEFICELLDSRIKSNKMKPNTDFYNITLGNIGVRLYFDLLEACFSLAF